MRRAFTLLEVIIALSILAVGLMVLVESQASAVHITDEADRIRVATLLAHEKMTEAQLRVEMEGLSESDIEEEGDFSTFGEEEFRDERAVELEFGDAFSDFRWAYTIRRIELDIPGDLMGTAESLVGGGYYGEQAAREATMQGQVPELTDFLQPEMLTEMLSPYLREVRVRVWWGEGEEDDGQMVEFVSHVINPTGAIVPGGETDLGTQP